MITSGKIPFFHRIHAIIEKCQLRTAEFLREVVFSHFRHQFIVINHDLLMAKGVSGYGA
jgi:hypothetical protein